MINTNASVSALNHGHHQKVVRPEAKDPRPVAKDPRPVAEPTAATVQAPTDAMTRAASTPPTEEFSPVRGKSVAHQVRAAFAELGDGVALDKPFGQYVSQQARFGSIEALLPVPVEEPVEAVDEPVADSGTVASDSSDTVTDSAVADSSDLDTSETDDSVVADDSVANDLGLDDTVSSAEIAAEILDDIVDSAVDGVADALT